MQRNVLVSQWLFFMLLAIRGYFLCSWSVFKPSFEQTIVTFFSSPGFLSAIAWDSFIKMPSTLNKLLFLFRIYQH